jgi:hypothetical protein
MVAPLQMTVARSSGQVLARDCDWWSDVVERLVRPDPEFVEHRSDSNLLELDAAVSWI